MRPTDDQLLRYKRGTLPAGEVATVEAWMDATDDADAHLAKLDAPDSLAVALADAPKKVDSSTFVGETADVNRPAADSDAPIPPLPPGYRLVKELGRGGMGVVLHADDTTLGRPVAVKMMLPAFAARPDAKVRFLREARSLAAVESEHIVPVFHVGETADGTPYLVMPLLAGETLDARLARGTLTEAELLAVARGAAEGLKAAHAKGLIHRDIKPSNLWLEADESGRFRRARLLDFGLARPTQSEVVMTATGQLLGTPAYMSPEQTGSDPLTPATDLFSLGATLYHAAAGRRPFAGDTPMTIVKSLALDTPAPVRLFAPRLSEPVARLIDDLLAKDPTRRPTAADVVSRLDAPTAPTRRKPNRGPLVALAAAVLAFVLLAGAVYQFAFTTKDGTLTVEVDDEADVRFKKGKLEVYDERGALKYTLELSEKNKTLPPGKYQVKVVGADGMTLDTETFEMAKDGKVKVRVTAKKPDDPKKPDPKPPLPGGPSPFDQLDRKAIPPEELLDTVPEGLVAVLGSRQCRSWQTSFHFGVAFRPDGNQVVYPDEWGQGSVFDVKSGRRTKLPARIRPYPHVYSADGSRLLLANYVDEKFGIQIIDVSEKEPKPTFFLPVDPKLNFGQSWQRSADGKTVCSSGNGTDELILDWPERDKLAVRCTIPRKAGFASRISADGKTLAIRSYESAALEVWDVAGKEPKKRAELPGDKGKLAIADPQSVFDFLPDGRLVALHADNRLRVWDVSGEKPTATWVESWKENPRVYGWNVRVAPSGDTVALFDESRIHSMTVPKTGTVFGPLETVEVGKLNLEATNLYNLEFSADGKRALTTHHTGYFVVWDVTAGGFAVHSAPKQSAFHELGISPDGKTLIGGSQYQATRYEFGGTAPMASKAGEGMAGLWQDLRLAWRPGSLIRPLGADNSKPVPLSEEFGGGQWDDHSSASLNVVEVPGQQGQRRWRCWDVSTDKPTKVAELKQSAEVPVLLFAGGKHVISSSGYDGGKAVTKFTLWTNDGGTYKPTDTFEIAGDGIGGMASSPDGKRVATLRGQVYDVADGKIKLLKTVPNGGGPFYYSRPVFSPDGKKLAFPGRVTVWDIESELREYQWPEELSATKVLFAPDGRHLITANANGTAFVIRLAAAPDKPTPPPAIDPKAIPKPPEPGKPLSAKAPTQKPKVFDGIQSWTVEAKLQRGEVYAVAYSADGKKLAVGGGDGTIRILDAKTFAVTEMFVGMNGEVRYLAWYAKGDRLLAFAGKNEVTAWEYPSGKKLFTLPVPHQAQCSLSPDGKKLLIGNELYDAETGTKTVTLNTKMPWLCAWHPKGKLVALTPAGVQTVVEVIDVEKNEVVQTYQGKNDRDCPQVCDWSRDGKLLVSWGVRGYLSYQGDEEKEWGGEPGSPMRFSHDGKHLLQFERRYEAWSSQDVTKSDVKPVVFLTAEEASKNRLYVDASSVAWAISTSAGGVAVAAVTELRVFDKDFKPVYTSKAFDGLKTRPDGHYKVKDADADQVAYVIQTKDGQKMLTPAEFEKLTGWKNDPTKLDLSK